MWDRNKIEEGHDNIVEEVLRKIVENNLFVKLEKCVSKVRKIGFLGVVIGLDGVKTGKEKVQGVVDWLVLRSIKDVQTFLRLVSYYRWFVKDFTKVVKPLHKMTKKDVKWN